MNILKIPSDYLYIGKLGKTFQLSGGIRFYPLGPAEANIIFDIDEVFISDFGKTNIREIKEVGKNIIIYFTRALDIEKAKSLVNKGIYVAGTNFDKQLGFFDDLIRQKVFLDNEYLGQVKEINGSKNIILYVESKTGQVLIPLEAPFVQVKEGGIFLENLPEGLIDLNK